jgi:hypothetical protein
MTTINNITFSDPAVGSITAICTQIQYGPTIISTQDESATLQAFYPHATQYNSFSVSVLFTTIKSRVAFYNYIKSFLLASTKIGTTAKAGAMRVQGPLGFDFYGCPSQGMMQQTQVNDVTWTMDLYFVGAQMTKGASFSDTTIFKDTSSTTAYYYPSNTQSGGTATDAGGSGVYDPPTDTGKNTKTTAPSAVAVSVAILNHGTGGSR